MVVALTITEVAAGGRVASGTSPLAELLACLHVIAEPDHHPESRRWIRSIRDQIPPRLLSDLERFAPLWARYRARLLYPLTLDLGRSLQDELHALSALDEDTFIPLSANAIRGRTFATARVQGAGSTLLETPSWVQESTRLSFARGDLAHALITDPDRFRRDLLEVLAESAAVFFDDEWARLESLLVDRAESTTAQLSQVSLAEAVAELSDIASLRSSTDTVFFDKLQSARREIAPDGLVLIPSAHAWPHLIIKLDHGLPVVIPYLVQEGNRHGDAPQTSQLRRRLAAFTEPARWELSRHLIGESITTTELARRTGMTKYAVSRHLRIMRECGLISSQRDGRQVFHRMSAAVIANIGYEALRGIIQ